MRAYTLNELMMLTRAELGVCAAGAAQIRVTGKIMVWKTQALCATVRPK